MRPSTVLEAPNAGATLVAPADASVIAATPVVPIVRPGTYRSMSGRPMTAGSTGGGASSGAGALPLSVAASHSATIRATALSARLRQLQSRGGGGGGDDDAAAGVYEDDSDDGEDAEATLASLSSKTRASYHAAQLSRPLVTVEPSDVSDELR
jgi:hypothetical protein